jgi:hypothetical protein
MVGMTLGELRGRLAAFEAKMNRRRETIAARSVAEPGGGDMGAAAATAAATAAIETAAPPISTAVPAKGDPGAPAGRLSASASVPVSACCCARMCVRHPRVSLTHVQAGAHAPMDEVDVVGEGGQVTASPLPRRVQLQADTFGLQRGSSGSGLRAAGVAAEVSVQRQVMPGPPALEPAAPVSARWRCVRVTPVKRSVYVLLSGRSRRVGGALGWII